MAGAFDFVAGAPDYRDCQPRICVLTAATQGKAQPLPKNQDNCGKSGTG